METHKFAGSVRGIEPNIQVSRRRRAAIEKYGNWKRLPLMRELVASK